MIVPCWTNRDPYERPGRSNAPDILLGIVKARSVGKSSTCACELFVKKLSKNYLVYPADSIKKLSLLRTAGAWASAPAVHASIVHKWCIVIFGQAEARPCTQAGLLSDFVFSSPQSLSQLTLTNLPT